MLPELARETVGAARLAALRPHGLSWLWQTRADLVGLVLVLGLAGAYAVAVRWARGQGAAWPARRSAAWRAGIAVLAVATLGPLGVYGSVLAWVQAVQVLTLLLVVPTLLALGRPLLLAQEGERHGVAGASALLRVVSGRPVRWLGSPLVAPLLVPLTLGALWGTALLLEADRSRTVAGLVTVGLLAVGGLVALGVVGDGGEAEPSGLLGLAAAVGVVELLLDAVPGLVVRLSTSVLAGPWWLTLHRGWGPDPLADQQTAGAVLWAAAEALDLPFLIVVVARWVRADARQARLEDAATQSTDDEGPQRPWWETDPQRLGAARSARYRTD